MPDESDESGWQGFAAEYIRFVDEGDSSRTMLLDDIMLEECGNVDGQLILDIGAGEGRFSRMLARAWSPHHRARPLLANGPGRSTPLRRPG